MPHKYNADRRHHIARPKRRVTNGSAYNEALRQRGSLTVWFTEDAIAAWKAAPRTTPGGQPHYSDLAITAALILFRKFHVVIILSHYPTFMLVEFCRCSNRLWRNTTMDSQPDAGAWRGRANRAGEHQ